MVGDKIFLLSIVFTEVVQVIFGRLCTLYVIYSLAISLMLDDYLEGQER